MREGDFAAIVKFSGTAGPTVVQPFVEIDSGGAARSALMSALMAPYAEGTTNLMDALNVSLNQFITPPPSVTLPPGPKAIIMVTDGIENASTTPESAVVDSALANSIPIFTIGVTDTRNTALLHTSAETDRWRIHRCANHC